MLSEKQKELLKKLNLQYPCVAIKFRFEKPDVPHYEGEKVAYWRSASSVWHLWEFLLWR